MPVTARLTVGFAVSLLVTAMQPVSVVAVVGVYVTVSVVLPPAATLKGVVLGAHVKRAGVPLHSAMLETVRVALPVFWICDVIVAALPVVTVPKASEAGLIVMDGHRRVGGEVPALQRHRGAGAERRSSGLDRVVPVPGDGPGVGARRRGGRRREGDRADARRAVPLAAGACAPIDLIEVLVEEEPAHPPLAVATRHRDGDRLSGGVRRLAQSADDIDGVFGRCCVCSMGVTAVACVLRRCMT